MTRLLLIPLLMLLFAGQIHADTAFATRNLRPGDIVVASDIAFTPKPVPGAATDLAQIVGREVARAIFANTPIYTSAVRTPVLVKRNHLVAVTYRTPLISIRFEARALAQGEAGEVIPLMNLASRKRFSGVVVSYGQVEVTE